jgi:hypothetical protein
MSRIIKSIALDEQTARIADTLPNFSHFVRECLYRHAVSNTLECSREKIWRGTDRCNPFKQPVCFNCWPFGAPPVEAVRQWSTDKLAMNFLDERAKKHNEYLIDLAGINRKVKKRLKSPVKVGFFASIRQKIRDRSP